MNEDTYNVNGNSRVQKKEYKEKQGTGFDSYLAILAHWFIPYFMTAAYKTRHNQGVTRKHTLTNHNRGHEEYKLVRKHEQTRLTFSREVRASL